MCCRETADGEQARLWAEGLTQGKFLVIYGRLSRLLGFLLDPPGLSALQLRSSRILHLLLPFSLLLRTLQKYLSGCNRTT